MSERDIGDYLQDILETIESCERFIEGMDFDQFVSLNVIWNTAAERLPELKRDIEKILDERNFE
jgi:uncharacterized protein with HEPN domain